MKNAVFWDVAPCNLVWTDVSEEGIALKMEAMRSSETSVHTRSTRRHITEDGILNSYRRENLKSYIFFLSLRSPRNINCNCENTIRKPATATQLQFPRTVISLSWTHVTEWSSANCGNDNAVSSFCAAPFSNMCSTQADNSSRKFQLRCGCQFPWCALGLTV
jgi:hypothetical protein